MNVKFTELNLIQDSIARENEIAKQRFDSLKVDFLRLDQFKIDVTNASAENKKYWVRENWLRVGIMAGVVATFVKIVTVEPRN